MPGKSGFGTAWQTTHIHIQQLETGLVVVPIALAVLSVNHIKGVLHLVDILRCTGIQRLLDDRLFRTCASAKGEAQAWISSQAAIDFYQPMGSGQQADQGVVQLVSWCMLHRLLSDLHLGADRAKQIELTRLHSYGSQRSSRAKMVRRACDTLVHEDAPPNEIFFGFFMSYGASSCFSQALQGLANLSLFWAKARCRRAT
jgi:hypothetical protein